MISVIIPIYNNGGTIKHCLDCIVPALGQQDEVIIVDDGSQDNGKAICQAYAEQFSIIKIISQNNQGPSVARNKGIEMAREPYIMFFDGDDKIDTALFASFVAFMRAEEPKYSDVDVWLNDFVMQTQNGLVCDSLQSGLHMNEQIIGMKALYTYLSGRGTYANVWRCVFRRDFLVKNNIRFKDDIRCGEDLVFMTQCFSVGKQFLFYCMPFYYYIVEQGESLSHNRSLQSVMDFFAAFDASYTYIQQDEVGNCLKKKLLREMIMILPRLSDLSEEKRLLGEEAFMSHMPLLKESPTITHRMIYIWICLFGISGTSRLFAALRRWRRRLKGLSK